MPSNEPAFLVEGQIVCRDCHDQQQPVCGYCSADLPEPPESKAKCPHCGQTVFRRKDQRIYDTTVLTRQQVRELETLRSSDLEQSPAMDRRFARIKSLLTTPTGTNPTPDRILEVLKKDLINHPLEESKKPKPPAQLEPKPKPKPAEKAKTREEEEEEEEGIRIEIGPAGRMPVEPAGEGQMACYNCGGPIDLALGVYEYLGQKICLECNGILNTSNLTETRVIRQADIFDDMDEEAEESGLSETLPSRSSQARKKPKPAEGSEARRKPKTPDETLIKFYCRACGQKLGVPDKWIGRRLPCSRCKKLNWVPPESDTKRPKLRKIRK
ncbi:MAG: hypothetical protein R3236_06715 [Phycisphaeraceae bacterium]|nr:hypothetical protein [Phycisphaeraceae bacterium]